MSTTTDPTLEQRDDEGPDGPNGRTTEKRSRFGFLGSLPALILLALVIAVLVKSFLIQAFYIPSPSMEPTLVKGDRVFVNKFVYDFGDVHRGDVIVFSDPEGSTVDRGLVGGFVHWLGEGIGVAQPENEDFIKRVIGLPGETLEIHDHTVYIDGKALAEPYLTDAARRANGDFGPIQVPQGKLFVMGDNRGNSLDSRFGLGFVPIDKVIGRAFVIIWPPSDVGGLGG
jgi:signal peptidase I